MKSLINKTSNTPTEKHINGNEITLNGNGNKFLFEMEAHNLKSSNKPTEKFDNNGNELKQNGNGQKTLFEMEIHNLKSSNKPTEKFDNNGNELKQNGNGQKNPI